MYILLIIINIKGVPRTLKSIDYAGKSCKQNSFLMGLAQHQNERRVVRESFSRMHQKSNKSTVLFYLGNNGD